MKKTIFVAIAAILTFMQFYPSKAVAQTASTLGFDVTTTSQYECLRYGDPHLNTIRITRGSSKPKILKVSIAKNGLKAKISDLSHRSNELSADISDYKKAKGKLETSIYASLPANLNKILALKKKIDKLTIKVAELNASRITLQLLSKEVTDCSKAAPANVNGAVRIIGRQYYSPSGSYQFAVVVGWVYKYDLSPPDPFCAFVTGDSESRNGWSQILRNEPPVSSKLRPSSDPCYDLGPTKGSIKCLDPGENIIMIASTVGPEAPGTCPYRPSACSMADAMTEAGVYFGGILFDKVVSDNGTCPG